LTNNSTNI